MATEKALRYDGGGSLSFRDGSGARRQVLSGASFFVDASTAAVLLEDPLVVEVDAEDVTRETNVIHLPKDQGRAPEAEQTPPQIDIVKASKTELLKYAKLLGLTMAKTTPVAKVRSAIEAELKHRQAGKAPLPDPTSTEVTTGKPVPFADVKARAIELGIKAVGVKRVDLEAAILAAEAVLVDAAAAVSSDEADQGGDRKPADDSGATVPAEAGTPPSDTGAITLGDLPAGGVVGGNR